MGKRRKNRPSEPRHVIVSLDGSPIDGGLYDDCPLCQDLARSGQPLFTFDETGELVEVEPSMSSSKVPRERH